MASPNEVVDDLTETVTAGKLVYTVRKPPYLTGTVSVFRNGMLQHTDFWTETDPATGLVTIDEEILIREEGDFSIHVAYETYEPVFVDPNAPVHISKIKPGDVLRIAMRAGRHLDPVVQPKGKQTRYLVRTQARREGCKKVSGRAASGFSRTVFLGFVTTNDSVSGVLHLQVESRERGVHYAAEVSYRDIQNVRKYVTPGKPRVKAVPIGGGQRAIRRPGAIAKGVLDYPGFMNLVRVFF